MVIDFVIDELLKSFAETIRNLLREIKLNKFVNNLNNTYFLLLYKFERFLNPANVRVCNFSDS